VRITLRSLAVVFLATVGIVLLALSNTVTSLVPVLAATALVMGGNINPFPDATYVNNQTDRYIVPFFGEPEKRVSTHTPSEFWPVNGTLTFDQSTVEGVGDLEDQMAQHPGDSLIVLGFSASARIATTEKRRLIEANCSDPRNCADPADFANYPDVSFVLISNVNKGNGGILQRFRGWKIPILGVTFDGATPTDSPQNPNRPGDHALDTKDITVIHDGWSDFPLAPTHVLALANAIAGIAYLHSTYPTMNNPVLVPQGASGDTDFYVIETDIVPLLIPLEQIGIPRPILLALDEPMRVMIETAYRRDIDPGKPTPAYLFTFNNPIRVAANLVRSIPVGIDDALEASGLGRALGTTPSGPYGVGGEDEDLKRLPPGVIPLGLPTFTNPLDNLAAANNVTAKTEPVVANPALSAAEVPNVDPPAPDVMESDAQVTETEELQREVLPVQKDAVVTEEDDTTPAAEEADKTPEPSNPASDRPKPVRPKLRAPIDFDHSPSVRPSGDRPLTRVLNTLTGQRPKSTAEADEPADDQAAPAPTDSEDAA
jgi:hypothetical protein